MRKARLNRKKSQGIHSPDTHTIQHNPVQPNTQINPCPSILYNYVTPHLVQHWGKQWGTATAR